MSEHNNQLATAADNISTGSSQDEGFVDAESVLSTADSIASMEDDFDDSASLSSSAHRLPAPFADRILALLSELGEDSALAAIMNSHPSVGVNDARLWLSYMSQCASSGRKPAAFIMKSFPNVSWYNTILAGNGALVPELVPLCAPALPLNSGNSSRADRPHRGAIHVPPPPPPPSPLALVGTSGPETMLRVRIPSATSNLDAHGVTGESSDHLLHGFVNIVFGQVEVEVFDLQQC